MVHGCTCDIISVRLTGFVSWHPSVQEEAVLGDALQVLLAATQTL